jgi:hypothetical protein
VAQPPEKKITFTTRLPEHTAKLIRGLAQNEHILTSTIIAELVEEAIQTRVQKTLATPPPPPPPVPLKPKRDMSDACELVLKEIRRRGGNKELENKLEVAIREHREKEKRRNGQ